MIVFGIVISLVYVVVFAEMEFDEKKEIVTTMSQIILPIMGYLFGRAK